MGCGASADRKTEMLTEHSPLGAYLNSEELERMAGLCTINTVAQGEVLPESPFYVIISGSAEVTEDGAILCTKHKGAFFTRRAGLIRGSSGPNLLTRMASVSRITYDQAQQEAAESSSTKKRTSIVKDFPELEDVEELGKQPRTVIIAKEPTQVLWIRVDNLDKFLSVCQPETSEVVKQITRTNIGTQLSQVPFIQACTDLVPADLRALGEICSYQTYQQNEMIFKQGDKAEYFYIILKGSVEITIDVAALRGSGETVNAGTRLVGDSFGVAALIYNAAERKYSVKALDRTLTLIIAKVCAALGCPQCAHGCGGGCGGGYGGDCSGGCGGRGVYSFM